MILHSSPGKIFPLPNTARKGVLDEAHEWLGTPFHHEGRVKGKNGGVDCAQLLIGVYANAGQIEEFQTEHYPAQWHLHRSEEKYLSKLLDYAVETNEPLPGDMALFHIGRTWSHGGIIVAWPTVIHAWFQTTVELANAELEPLRSYERKFFTLKEWK